MKTRKLYIEQPLGKDNYSLVAEFGGAMITVSNGNPYQTFEGLTETLINFLNMSRTNGTKAQSLRYDFKRIPDNLSGSQRNIAEGIVSMLNEIVSHLERQLA